MDPQDHERFRDFVDARWSALLRLANLLTGGDRHEAEDLVQTALMKALGRWRHIEDPEGYVRKVMYRHQISRWRLRRRTERRRSPRRPRVSVSPTAHPPPTCGSP